MKKFLIIFGTVVLFMITVGTLFKLMHWPGSGPMLVVGMFFFCTFYLPLFFIQRMISNKTGLNITTNIFGLISTNLLFTGVMFKVMHWPGAGPMIVLGATTFIFPTIILYAIQQFKEYDRKFPEFWRLVVMSVLVCVFLVFWGTSVSRNILTGFLEIEDGVLVTNTDLQEYNSFIISKVQQKDSAGVYMKGAENIDKQAKDLCQFIEDLKKELVMRTAMDPAAVDNHWNINAKDNYDIPTHFLGTSQSVVGQELFNRLNDFKKTLSGQLNELPLDKTQLEQLGDFGIVTELKPEMTDGYEMEWNVGVFEYQTVVGSLALLTSIENQVLNAEFKSLKLIETNMK